MIEMKDGIRLLMNTNSNPHQPVVCGFKDSTSTTTETRRRSSKKGKKNTKDNTSRTNYQNSSTTPDADDYMDSLSDLPYGIRERYLYEEHRKFCQQKNTNESTKNQEKKVTVACTLQ